MPEDFPDPFGEVVSLGPPVSLKLERVDGICLLANLQLILRHPLNRGAAGKRMRAVGRELQKLVAQDQPSYAEFADDSVTENACVKCDSPVEDLMSKPGRSVLSNGLVVYPMGPIIVPSGAIYCAVCAPRTRVCKRCACTDLVPCTEGCGWEFGREDLCGTCIDRQRKLRSSLRR